MPWRRRGRFWRHVITDHTDARRALPKHARERLEQVVADGERRHRGQVCVAVEAALPIARVWQKQSPRNRALEVFGLMRVWDTEENTGVLVYVLLADRDVEIVADRGIHGVVGDAPWEAICRTIEAAFREGRFAEGLERGVEEIGALLEKHFPRTQAGANELPDRVRML